MLRVFDQVSQIERTVTQKAYNIINKRKPRYKILAYVDENGNEIDQSAIASSVTDQIAEKKSQQITEPEKSAEPVVGDSVPNSIPEGVTVVRRKPGPKPKIKDAQE